MSEFAGKGVVVIGAAQGMGRGVAERFASQGAGVLAFDVEADILGEMVAAVSELGGAIEGFVGDVSHRQDVRHAVERCVGRYGHLDALVMTAAITMIGPFLETTDDGWRRTLDINLTGTFYAVQEAGRIMVKQRSGAMVVISSTNALTPERGLVAYNTSKVGQLAIVRTAAMEFAPYGVRVNAVEPGIVDTRMAWFVTRDPGNAPIMLQRIPVGRFAQPVDIAKPILFLCSDDAEYITGEVLVVDGGMTAWVAPAWTEDGAPAEIGPGFRGATG